MTPSKGILAIVEAHLSTAITGSRFVSGGSINIAYELQTATGKYFLKVNHKTLYPGMFEAEAQGLQLMTQTGTVRVPSIILQGDAGNESFLLLEWIDSKRGSVQATTLLGTQLADMHRNTAERFGLDHDNYMGSLPQSNRKHNKWSDFFVQERLQPMVSMAVDKRLLEYADAGNFEKLYAKLPELFDEEAPALLHGDLWSGNYLTTPADEPYLIDPAVYYGNREADLAMTTLFGGFSNEFYLSYHEAFPLSKGWQQRTDLWNLYPLLVHLNLFGAGYLGRVRDAVNSYL
ncbi:fructosamine kinase family protein [Mucilaginibacter auburnensis]|uniref:Fructosamine-3-kinase n=1 Tax=Mucilaginibacter auburnensis TaxID=1457233 RepID=A0A2H9VMF9_9SPHI|nr:fructosamine kinase family protein [Mucilaginibacter auburnensis]PJJ79512.1 fructosamine-3-kinase [Mucilaginibacter auburnensis]